MLAFWNTITDLGHSSLLLPVAAVMALWLWIGGARRVALVWALSFGLAIILDVATKIAFFGWGIGIQSLDFTGISGHTLLASAIFPVVAELFSLRSSQHARRMATAIAGALVLLIGLSRYFVHAHSPAEIVAGWWLGIVVAICTLFVLRRSPAPRLPSWTLLAALLIAAFSLNVYGQKPEAHGLIIKLAMRWSGHNFVYTRAGWKG